MAVRSVLIIEHDSSLASDLAHRVEQLGYAVTTTTAARANAVARQTKPHLAVVHSAIGDARAAIESAEAIRKQLAIPVVLVGAESSVGASDRANVVEPYGYLATPFTDRELRGTLALAFCQYDSSRQIHELEDRFFSVSIDLLCFLDFDGYFKRLNPAWERTLGFSRTELMSRPFIEFVHPDDRARTLNQNRDVRGGGKALGFENRYLCKDGSYRWLLWNAAPDADERVIYSVARDVTVQKQVAEDRERLVQELQAALAEVRSLQEILPICSYCKKIRDDANYWQHVESYISAHTNTRFSHGICPDCYRTQVEPQLGSPEA